MPEVISDVRLAVRSLGRAPGFALVALLTLALGIGANSAIFSVINSVVIRPLPYPDAERLVRVSSRSPGFEKFWISPPEFFELKERTSSFASLGGYRAGMASVGGGETPVRVPSAVATHDLFTTLGVRAHLGRPFAAEEDLPGAEWVATLSYELWQRAFGGDPSIVGRTVLVNGNASRVTGVMPPRFDIADERAEIWVPARLDPAAQNRGNHYLEVVGRLARGVSFAGAVAELDGLLHRWSELNPGHHVPNPDVHPLFLADLREDWIGPVRPALMVLLGAVGFVLLIACANVANLLLARAESRQREIAVRSALGAGRARLLRQFLTEGVVLATAGGALGLVLGWAAVRLLISTNPDGVPRSAEIGLDATVALFTLAVSLLTGLLFGLAPALHLTRREVTSALRDGSGRTTASGGRQQVRRLLVVSELALAVILVAGSTLMLRSFAELQRVDPGFQADGLLAMQLFLPAPVYPQPEDQYAFYQRLLPRLAALPGVERVTTMNGLPPRRDVVANDMTYEGVPFTPGGPGHSADYWQYISTGYLQTMGIPVVDGRDFVPADEVGDGVVLINETLARLYYADVNPIGRRVRPPGPDDTPWFTIIGVVKDVKQGGLSEPTGTEVYFFYPQIGRLRGFAPRSMHVVLRTPGDPMRLAADVRREVREIDAALPVARLATMNSVLYDDVAAPRFMTLLLGIFAAVALALAAIGTYGVMSYIVLQRRQEIGIRMALGAHAGRVQRMIVSQGAATAAVGLLLGTAGALLLSRFIGSLLFNVSPTDVRAFVTAPLLLAVVALAACWIPARRATRVDPASVLKPE